jgi:hypothetical protein
MKHAKSWLTILVAPDAVAAAIPAHASSIKC